MHPSRVFSSISFDNCIHQCNHHSNRSAPSQKPFGSTLVNFFLFSHCLIFVTIDLLHLYMDSMYVVILMVWTFCFWFLLLNTLFLRFMHVVCISSSFFLLLISNKSIIRIQHSLVDGDLHCFHFLAIINMAKNILVQDFGKSFFHFFWVNI